MAALAWLLATHPDDQLRNGAEALAIIEPLAKSAAQDDPVWLNSLAATYAELGRFDEAISAAERARDAATKAKQPGLAAGRRAAARRISPATSTSRAGGGIVWLELNVRRSIFYSPSRPRLARNSAISPAAWLLPWARACSMPSRSEVPRLVDARQFRGTVVPT